MSKTALLTSKAPQPIGPYSQAIQVGNLIFCSGQIALDPQTGQLVAGGVQDHARRVLENLKAVLEAGGAKLEHVVKTTIFLKSMGDFALVNEIYASYFGKTAPARTTVEVSELPKESLVEIEAVAHLG